MKSIILKITALSLFAFTTNVSAIDMPAKAKQYHCTNCHSIDVKMIGPAWMDISKAYNSNGKTSTGIRVSDILSSKTPEEWLKDKISHGGAGTWGKVMMPPTDPSHVWEKQMDKLIRDILALSKDKTSKEEMLKTADYYRCVACHKIDEAGIGPSWMDISTAYNTNATTPYGTKISDILKQKTAEEWLMFKVSHGGQGNWGGMLMPAMEYVVKPGSFDLTLDEEQRYKDMQELVKFILNLAKK